MMKEETKSGYIAGIICLMAALIFGIVIINMSWNLSAQVLSVFVLVFSLLGTGSFWKPEVIGAVASQLLENIARNTQEQGSRTNKQSQKQPKESPQIIAEKSNINITYNQPRDKEKKEK